MIALLRLFKGLRKLKSVDWIAVCGTETGQGIHTEEASGFKPYIKRLGMPVSSLPPAKRFAAALREQPASPQPGVGASPAKAQSRSPCAALPRAIGT